MANNIKQKQSNLKEGTSKLLDYNSIYEKYKKEFIDNCEKILLEKEEIFLNKFYKRMNIIFSDIFKIDILNNKEFEIIKNKVEINFYNDIYKKMHNQCLNTLKQYNENKKDISFLNIFLSHCNSNQIPIHICKGKFIIVTEKNNKNKILYVICSNCKKCYFENSILMFCQKCKEEFYSSIISYKDKILPPATWEKYHCNVLFCEQMSCIKCGAKFFLKNNNLFCKKCKFLINPLDIMWKCIICKKEFQSHAKIFNPLEFKVLNLAVKNALVEKKITKPKYMECGCFKESDIYNVNFYHNNECDGVLFHGILSNHDIVVCSKCKIMKFLDKFSWFCPSCKMKFKCIEFNTFEFSDSENIHIKNNPRNYKLKNKMVNHCKNLSNSFYKKNNLFICDNNSKTIECDVNEDIISSTKNNNLRSRNNANSNNILSFGSISELHDKLFKSMKNFPGPFLKKIKPENLMKLQNKKNETKEEDIKKENYDYNIINKETSKIQMNEKLKGNLKLDLKNITERKKSKSKSKEKERSITDRELNKSKIKLFHTQLNYPNTERSYNKIDEKNPINNLKKIRHFHLNSIVKKENDYHPISNRIMKNERNKIKDLLHLLNNEKDEKKPLKTEFQLFNRKITNNNNKPNNNINLSKINNSQTNIFDNKIILKIPSINEDISYNKKKYLMNIENTKENFSRKNTHEIQKNEILSGFNFDDFTIITQIGQGTFGKIYLVHDLNNKLYSMKKIIISDEIELNNLIKEYNLCNKLIHPNIIKILGLYKNKLDKTTYVIYILMEVGTTDWEKEIKNNALQKKMYKEEDLILILKQLCSALAFLQRKRVSHRDIKPQNILVFQNKIYKLADFGEAKQILFCNDRNTLKGTELYMSPLLYNGLKTNQIDIKHNLFKSDVYSLGLCILYAATLNVNYLCKIRNYFNMRFVRSFIFDLLKKNYKEKFIDLLCLMLEINEEKRPDFIEMERLLNSWDK